MKTFILVLVVIVLIPFETYAKEPYFIRDGSDLWIGGYIDRGFANKFGLALNQNPGVRRILLESPGGEVTEAIHAGRIIRARKLETSLLGDCQSACVLVFVGGVKRSLWTGKGNLGFHRADTNGKAVPMDDYIYPKMEKYFTEMGVDYPRVLHWMKQAEPSSMFFVSDWSEFCGARVATWVENTCGK